MKVKFDLRSVSEWKEKAAKWMINSTEDVRDEVSISWLQALYSVELEAIDELEGKKIP